MSLFRRKYYQLEDGSMIRVREIKRTQRHGPGNANPEGYCCLILDDGGWYKITDKDFDEINRILGREEEKVEDRM